MVYKCTTVKEQLHCYYVTITLDRGGGCCITPLPETTTNSITKDKPHSCTTTDH